MDFITAAPVAIEYIINTPYFWQSMGAVSATSMFVGALMFNGELSQASKGILNILIYAGLLFYTTINRIVYVGSHFGITDYARAFAGLWTLILLTFFYILGILIGVGISAHVRRNKTYK